MDTDIDYEEKHEEESEEEEEYEDEYSRWGAYHREQAMKVRDCYVCKETFSSYEQLLEHHRKYPKHRCGRDEITYTYKCRKCDYHNSGLLHMISDHFIPIGKRKLRVCDGVYIHSIEVTPYGRVKDRYSILGTDESVANIHKIAVEK